jgi:hypothetical protein
VNLGFTQGPIATDLDGRIANLLNAWATDTTMEGEAIRWALRSWHVARLALQAIKEAVDEGPVDKAELLEIVAEGLEALPENA